MTRGFVTIATGDMLYYSLAKNLLTSYKLYTDTPYHFAIICDQENEITAQFDDVILLPDAKRNYYDKFELLIRAPYDETIFIDSDCLAYADLNQYWDYFRDADDFTAGGYDFPVDSQDGLFWEDSIGEYKGRVHWKPSIHGGLYFIRRGPVCDAIYRDYLNIMEHYQEYRWPDDCVDEPVFGLAMAANGCHSTPEQPENYIYPWLTTSLSCDIFTGRCSYTTVNGEYVQQGKMIHWSVRNCKKPLYRFEAEKAALLEARGLRPGMNLRGLPLGDRFLYQWKCRYYYLLVKEFGQKVLRKRREILGVPK